MTSSKQRDDDAPRAATTAARARPDATHCCAADRCYIRLPAHLAMCSRHWRAVPRIIKSAVLRHYRRGQTALTASPEYLDAMTTAVEALREAGAPR
jgi:hypothetical protein